MVHNNDGRTIRSHTSLHSAGRIAAAMVLAAALVGSLAETAHATVTDSVFIAVGGLADGNPGCDAGRSTTTSDSAITWPTATTAYTPVSAPPAPCAGGGELHDIARAGNTWVAVGTKTLASGSTQGVSFRSTNNGASWTQVGSIPPTPHGVLALEAVATNGSGRWAAGGYHGLWYSDDDGATWTPAVVPFVAAPYSVHDIAERPGVSTEWVAVGSDQPPAPNLQRSWYRQSTTGASWPMGGSFALAGDLSMNGVAIDPNGTVVAVGSTHLPSDPPDRFGPLAMTMPNISTPWAAFDQANWFNASKGGLNSVAVDASGHWLAVGTKSLGVPDAVAYRATYPVAGGTWTDASAGLPSGTSQLEGVETDRLGTWVAVGGDKGSVTRSTNNGAAWSAETQTMPVATGYGRLRSVAVRPGTFDPQTQ